MAVTDEMVEAAQNSYYTFGIDDDMMRAALEAALSLSVSNTGEWSKEAFLMSDDSLPSRVEPAVKENLTAESSELVKRLREAESEASFKVWSVEVDKDKYCAASALFAEAATALAKADARIAELEAQGWELSGSITDLGQRLKTAETLLEEARRALAPFIRLADNVFSDGKNATVADEVTLWCFNDTDITFGDLRRARATLDRIGK